MLQESIEKVLEVVSRHPKSPSGGQSALGIFVVPSPDRDSEAGRREAFNIIDLKGVKLYGACSVM